jgi:hypothetical protein
LLYYINASNSYLFIKIVTILGLTHWWSETGFFPAILRAARRLGKKFADEGLDACRTVFLNLPAIVLR